MTDCCTTRRLTSLSDVRPGDHLCAIYETDEEHRALVTPFLRQGLEQKQKVIYIADARAAEDILGYLRGDGFDVDRFVEDGRLTVLSSQEAYLRGDAFEPDDMIALLRQETEQALAEGFTALRVTGEMTWALRGFPGSRRLTEYESQLNAFLPESPCLAICQYDRRRFDPKVLLDVLMTHPIAVIGTALYESPYYVPPDELASPRRDAHRLDRWIGLLKSRREAQEALARSEERFRTVVEGTQAGYFSIDRDGRFQRVNDAWVRMHGYTSPDEVIGRHFALTQVEADLEQARRVVHRLFAGEHIPSGEFTRRGKDGSVGYHTFSASPVVRDGQVVGLEGFLIDITERKQAEEALRLHSLTLSQIQDRVTVTDLDGYITYVNDAVCRMLGKSREELVGQHVSAYGEDTATGAAQEEIIRKTRQDGVWRGEVTNLRADGSAVVLDCRTYVVKDEDGVPIALCGVSTDITERKRIEDQLREASKMEAVGRLAGGIAHEFNNLLMGIIGYTDFVHRRVDDPAIESDLFQVRQLADRGARLTQQLLAFGRKQRLEWKVLDLNRHIESTCRMLPRLIGEQVALQCSFAPDAGAVNADPAQITQVLVNLALNARDAMPEGGTLTVATANATLDAEFVREHPEAESGEYVMFSVTDTGRGMDEEALAHIFEPFYTTKGVGEGTGLGLATIYGIVRQHEGYIAVESEPGAGSVFRVYLPRAADTPEPTSIETPRPTGPGGQEVVLLVEDEPAVKDVATRILQRRGYQVLVAANADEAEFVAEQHDGAIDMLLTDVVMPGRNGHELYAALRSQHPALKVLFMSGYDEQSVAVRDVQAAGLPFIAKPMNVYDLAEKVREVLD